MRAQAVLDRLRLYLVEAGILLLLSRSNGREHGFFKKRQVFFEFFLSSGDVEFGLFY